jgi:PKD repeat protein
MKSTNRTLGHWSWGADVVTRRILVWAAIVTLGGCTLDKQAAPPLTGPSTFGQSVNVTISPDILTQDGQSQASVDVFVRDANSQPVRGLTLRLDLTQGGAVVGSAAGTLSSTTVSTDSNGHASSIFTAPPPPPLSAPDSMVVTINATAVGNNAQNSSVPGSAAVKLVRPGLPLGPVGTLTASFIFSPQSPKEGDSVQFDASSSVGDIVSYTWNFGDGSSASGVHATHAYSLAGQYTVVLTIKDSRGDIATSDPKAGNISIGASTDPTAAFSVSPTTVIAGTSANFNASASKAANGHQIVSYDWDFGDGTTGSGVTVSHTYALPQGYTVTLKVTDDTGRTGVLSNTVTAQTSNPTASFTNAPSAPHTTDVIAFDASGSTAVLGRVIVTYHWDFSGAFVGQANGATTSIGPIGGGGGTLTVKLTVTDSAGQIGILTRTIQILP